MGLVMKALTVRLRKKKRMRTGKGGKKKKKKDWKQAGMLSQAMLLCAVAA